MTCFTVATVAWLCCDPQCSCCHSCYFCYVSHFYLLTQTKLQVMQELAVCLSALALQPHLPPPYPWPLVGYCKSKDGWNTIKLMRDKAYCLLYTNQKKILCLPGDCIKFLCCKGQIASSCSNQLITQRQRLPNNGHLIYKCRQITNMLHCSEHNWSVTRLSVIGDLTQLVAKSYCR